MTDVEKARRLFQETGLAFPKIPEELAARLKEQDKWLFSTREIDMTPYNLQHYVAEVDETWTEDYAILSHSGHGINSYALQYYLVHGSLCMFLHLGWGGVYMDDKVAKADIRKCFSLADEIGLVVQNTGRLRTGDQLTIVGSDFYGSYWTPPGQSLRAEAEVFKTPAVMLAKVLHWLRSSQ